MFAAGGLGYLFFKQHPVAWRKLAGRSTLVAMVALLMIFAEGFRIRFYSNQVVVLVAPFLIVSLMDERAAISKVLSSRLLHWTGTISYSLYLCHWLVIQMFRHWHPDIIGSPAIHAVIMVAAALLLSAASYHALERPARRLVRRAIG